MALKRIFKELKDISLAPCEEVGGDLESDLDIFVWRCYIVGPAGTPYAGGRFQLRVVLPQDYPFKPPRVRFLPKVLHPNISLDGYISVDILSDCWTPALTLRKVLLALQSLLESPNSDDSMNVEAAALFKSDRARFNETAREWTLNWLHIKMAMKRIAMELKSFTLRPTEWGTADLIDDQNIYEWVASITGPANSPYEGGLFYLRITLPLDYPFKPPQVIFTTRVYHPNINQEGKISLAVLGPCWAPACTVAKLLLYVRELLGEPNPDDPLVPDIATLYKRDRATFIANAREWTHKYAM